MELRRIMLDFDQNVELNHDNQGALLGLLVRYRGEIIYHPHFVHFIDQIAGFKLLNIRCNIENPGRPDEEVVSRY